MSTAQISVNEASKVSFAPPAKVERPAQRLNVSENSPETPSKKSKRPLLILGALGVLLAGTAGYFYLEHASHFEETDNSFVEADVHPISARVSGTVMEVLVNDNEQVSAGQVLARLDTRDFDINLQSAKTELLQAQAQISQSEAATIQAQAELRRTEFQIQSSAAQLEKARLDFQRADQLFKSKNGVISTQEYDAVKATFDSAVSAHDATLAARDAAAANVQSTEANKAVSEARQKSAATLVENAELQRSYTDLVAPVSGKIGRKTVETGQRIQPGQAMMAVVADEKWIVANFKENQLSSMKLGQEVDITIDAISGKHFRGHVDSFAPGTGAKFALLPPDNATGNFTKIVQRVPVKVLFDKADLQGFENRIAPGLSAITEVRVN